MDQNLVMAIITATDEQLQLLEAAIVVRKALRGNSSSKNRKIKDYPAGREWTTERNEMLWSLVVDKKVKIKEASRQIGKSEAQTSAQLSKLRKWMNR